MLELLNRIRKIDLRKVTPTQWIVGLAALIIVMWVIGRVVSFITGLVPIAALILILYAAYRVISNRQKARNDVSARADTVMTEAETVLASEPKRENRRARREPAQVEEATETAPAVEEDQAARLRVAPKLNPDTGIVEADLSRLEALEQETNTVTDDVMAQIEARRRRLMGGEDADG